LTVGSSNDDELLAVVDEVLGGGLNACCGASGSLRIAKLLLAHGASPAYASSQDFDASPMHRCVQFGHDNLFALLLTHKVPAKFAPCIRPAAFCRRMLLSEPSPETPTL
jgi:ankyrin repeat protein